MNLKPLAVIAVCASTLAIAHEGATGEVAQRMDAMSAIGDNNRTLSNISRGRAEFDLATVVEAANAIASHSGQGFSDLFPEGSMSDVSDARAEIWQDWDKFSELSLSLESAANNLAKISSEDEFTAAYKQVSQTCGSCHRSFRAK